MQSVGQTLRDARLRNKLSLEQVSALTRITLKNLQAIEANDLTKISSAFFYKSFVRQFAEQVGVDFEKELAASVQQVAGTLPEPLMPGQGDAPLPKIASMRTPKPKRFRWLYSVASLVVMVVACSTLYAVWESSKSNLGAAIGNLVQSFERSSVKTVRSQPVKRRAIPAAPSPDPQTAAGAAAPLSSDPVPVPGSQASDDIDGFRIVLSALERTWLSVTTDGKPAYTGILQAEESKTLEGHDTAKLRTGNAGGITVVFNGKEIGSLGARGQVRTIVFTKDSYQIVDDGAPPVAFTLFSPIDAQTLPAHR